MPDELKSTQERCSCGGTIIFDDERGVARCPNCKSYEAYTTPALRERATNQPQTTREYEPAELRALYHRVRRDSKYGLDPDRCLALVGQMTGLSAWAVWAAIGRPEDEDGGYA